SGAGHHALTATTATRIGGYLAERLNRAPERAALADVPLGDLIAAQQGIAQEAVLLPDPARWGEVAANFMAFEPVIDGEVLPDLPIHRIAAGSAREVRVLVGANRDEQRLFLVPNRLIDMVNDALLQMVVSGYGLPAGGLDTYRAGRPGATPGELLADVVTDWFYRVPAVRIAEAQPAGTAWMYEFSWPSPQFDGRLGACHYLELGFTFDTLATEAHGVRIVAELALPIRHCLIAREGVGLESVRRVVSHPQALAQCADFLRAELPWAAAMAWSSTAEAVLETAARTEPWAAIGTPRAAALYGCVVLREGIEGRAGNETRFVWIAPAETEPDPARPPTKTSLAFWGAGAAESGWLVRCLSEFAFRGVNLTRIESRPRKDRLGSYVFFLDLEGGVQDERVGAAIAGVRSHADEVRVLGSYPAA
nr:carboxylesterase family protein [Actinomycetota bacterium]